MFVFSNTTIQYLVNKIKALIPTKTSQLQNDSNFLNNSSKIDLAKLTDMSSDNVFASDHSMNQLMYFKDNQITNISQVYKSGFYGTKNTDVTTPYKSYWFVVVFCKDAVNQIAVQWAMDVNPDHNGELWMRTVRLNAASTAGGNYIGPWRQFSNADTNNYIFSNSEPDNTKQLWIDSSTTPRTLKFYNPNTSTWEII